MSFKKFFFIFLILPSIALAMAIPSDLTIITPKKEYHFSYQQLLKSPYLTQVTINNDRAYPHREMTYQAIKLCQFLKPYLANKTDIVQFISWDNFFSLIPAQKILTCDAHSAIAYLGIETQEAKWPPLLFEGPAGTAGPYALIWVHPEKSHIPDEFWPWRVVTIKISPQMNKEFPAPPANSGAHILNGYTQFINNCIGCHQLNGLGKGAIGRPLSHNTVSPQLLVSQERFKYLIRHPEDYFKNPQHRMHGINEDVLTVAELDDLVAYLQKVLA